MKILRVSVAAIAFLGIIALPMTFAGGSKEGTANSAAYPTKPITIIVASMAGGGTDTMARLFAKFAPKYSDQPFVVVDKPGAGGQVGFGALARARKNGYTIGTLFTPHVVAHISSKRAKYTLNDFAMLDNVVTDPGVLVVNSNSPFKSLADIVAAARKKPGTLTSATTGPGGDDYFALYQFNEAAGIHITGVPSPGSAGEKTSVMGGHVDMACMNVSQVESNVQAGQLRWLGAMTKKRLSYLPNLPTFAEQGYNVISDSSRGFAAPAGLPSNAQSWLESTFTKVLHDPGFIKASKGVLLLNIMGPAKYTSFLDQLLVKTNQAYAKQPW